MCYYNSTTDIGLRPAMYFITIRIQSTTESLSYYSRNKIKLSERQRVAVVVVVVVVIVVVVIVIVRYFTLKMAMHELGYWNVILTLK